MKWTPFKHQKRGVKWLTSKPEAALFWEMGCAKTTVALKAFQMCQKVGAVKSALVVAPKRVAQEVWTHEEGGELSSWADFKDLKVVLLHGKLKEKRLQEKADLYVCTFDGLRWLIEKKHLQTLFRNGVDCLIVDELSKLKHPNTKTFKSIKPYLGKFRRRWGLTGTPAPNGLLDLFGEVYVLDQGRRLGRYITRYRQKYFNPTGYQGYVWAPKDGSERAIHAQIKDIALSAKLEECVDMPAFTERDVWVTLPSKAKKVYHEMEKELLAQLDSGVVVAGSAAVASGKCRQIASGGVYREDLNGDRQTELLHHEKTEALKEVVEELNGSPLLVGYEFKHDLARIQEYFGKDVPVIGGHTTDKKAAQYVRAFNAGDLPILCGHPASMGHGLNLQKSAHHVFWYTVPWDLELYTQLNGRLWRTGQTNKVVAMRCLARGTVDEVIANTLNSKRGTQGALMEALRRYRKAKV